MLFTLPTVKQEGPETDKGDGLFLTSTEDDDENHFDPTDFGKNRLWHSPKVEDMIEHYRYAKVVLDQAGVGTYNATAGGNLEVFPRLKFEDLF